MVVHTVQRYLSSTNDIKVLAQLIRSNNTNNKHSNGTVTILLWGKAGKSCKLDTVKKKIHEDKINSEDNVGGI